MLTLEKSKSKLLITATKVFLFFTKNMPAEKALTTKAVDKKNKRGKRDIRQSFFVLRHVK